MGFAAFDEMPALFGSTSQYCDHHPRGSLMLDCRSPYPRDRRDAAVALHGNHGAYPENLSFSFMTRLRTENLRELGRGARTGRSVNSSGTQGVPPNEKPLSRRAKGALVDQAERGGFEPPIRLPVYSISSAAPSASRTPLRGATGRRRPARQRVRIGAGVVSPPPAVRFGASLGLASPRSPPARPSKMGGWG